MGDINWQGMLAAITIIGALGLTALQILHGGSGADIPGWLQATAGSVVGFYFGGRTAGATASQVASTVGDAVANATQRNGGRSTDPTPPATPAGAAQ